MILRIPPTIPEDQGVKRLQYVIGSVSNVFQSDFVFFVNDHTFVFPEKLCSFLKKYNKMSQLYAGHALKNDRDYFAFNSGAAGYVLSRRTVQSLLQSYQNPNPACVPPADNKWLNGNPGLVTAKCLHGVYDVIPEDTRTFHNNQGSHVFHAYGIIRTATKDVDEWYINKHIGLDNPTFSSKFDESYESSIQEGAACCSEDTISFHYVKSYETLALNSIQQELLSSKKAELSDEELKSMIIQKWPDNDKNGWVGGYSKTLPKENDTEKWALILETFRKVLELESESESKCTL